MNNSKNWLKPDQSRWRKNCPEKNLKAHYTIIVIKTDTTSRRGATGDEGHDTSGTDHPLTALLLGSSPEILTIAD